MKLLSPFNKLLLSCFLLIVTCSNSWAQQGYIILPMGEDNQMNHLKAYGITYQVIATDYDAYWLLNYDGGSFAFPYTEAFRRECVVRGVSYKTMSETQFNALLARIADPERNMDAIKLEVAPKIAVYSPKVNVRGQEVQPWDDAVTLVLNYAEIPYDLVYDDEILAGNLNMYDWLHLHHEDFTGQFGKFYSSAGNQLWYKQYEQTMNALAKKHNYNKVSELKLDVVKKIREYVAGGGFMFAMCSATDSFDIALAADGVDICEAMFDGDPSEPNYQSKLNFNKTFAFSDFELIRNPTTYEFSSIDMTRKRRIRQESDYFVLKEFSAKWDQVPTMLCQNHTQVVKAFMGQTTSFDRRNVKSTVMVLGENTTNSEARYIHGTKGKGMFTFYGGHDPEDYRHRVGDPKTELDLHPTSPGYRLILNNVLFPAAKKKKQKT